MTFYVECLMEVTWQVSGKITIRCDLRNGDDKKDTEVSYVFSNLAQR